MGAISKIPLKTFNPNIPPYTPGLEYLGALIDGEGCITLTRSCATGARYQARLGISQKYLLNILKAVQAEFGGGLYESKRDDYRWAITGNPAANLLIEAYPFLIGKVYQAQLAIRYHGRRMGDPEVEDAVARLKNLKRSVLL